jgi:hypothetical protein
MDLHGVRCKISNTVTIATKKEMDKNNIDKDLKRWLDISLKNNAITKPNA